MGNTASNANEGTISSAIDSGMKKLLGDNAAIPKQPPKYDNTGLSRPKRGIEEGKYI